MAWVPSTPPVGSIILASETGIYYTNIGAGPGLLFPNPVLTQVLGAFWAVTTNSPQTEQTRTIQLQGLGPNGWYNMSAPYTEGFPYPTINLTGLPFTAVRFLYTLANGCQYYSGNGTFIPPVVPPADCTIVPDYSVSQAVDANMEGLTGDGYFFIATDSNNMGNAWAANLGSVVTVQTGLFTYSAVLELQTVYAIDTLLYWRIIGGEPAPLFPTLTATLTASPSGYFLESDWINASAAGTRMIIVEAEILGIWTIVYMGYEYDLPQQLPYIGNFTGLRINYIVGDCSYQVTGTVVTPEVLTIDTDCSELSYLFYRYTAPSASNSTWLFTTTNPVEVISLLFIAGGTATGNVIRLYDGPDDSSPALAPISGVTSLAGISRQSTGTQMFMKMDNITADMEADMATWWWQVGCLSGATPPTATVDIETKCDEYQFCVVVNVTSLGDATSIDIEYIVDGGAPAYISGIDATGNQSLGCFDYESEVVIRLIHNEAPLSNVTLGAYGPDEPCTNPCIPDGAFKIDEAGDLADLPAPPPDDPWVYLITTDLTGIGTFQIGEVIEYNSGVWTLFSALPGLWQTDSPLQYWQSNGPGVQPYPLLPILTLTPTGNSPDNWALYCPDITAYAIATNEPVALEVRFGTGPWTQVWTGTLQQIIVPLAIPIVQPFTSARGILNFVECGLTTGVLIENP